MHRRRGKIKRVAGADATPITRMTRTDAGRVKVWGRLSFAVSTSVLIHLGSSQNRRTKIGL